MAHMCIGSAAAPVLSRFCTRQALVSSRVGLKAATRLAARRCKHTVHAQGMKEIISTDSAPGAVGPYSQAIKTGNLLFISGQVGLVPGTKDFAGEDVEAQTEQVMSNMEAILKAAGCTFDNVVKTTVLLADMSDFQKVNAIYGKAFPKDPPARACFAVKTLPLNARVEIDAVACI